MSKLTVTYKDGGSIPVIADEFDINTIEINKKLFIPFYNWDEQHNHKFIESLVEEANVVSIVKDW